MKYSKEIIILISTLLLAVLLFLILDSAKLFYCINISGILLIVTPLIYLQIKKNQWSNFKKTQIKSVVFSIAFFAIIFTPLVQQLTAFISMNKINNSFDEKRTLADFKSVEDASILEIPTIFTTYYNDNFGARKFFIATNNYIKTRYFKISSKPAAVIGNGDWMFYNAEGSLADHQGKKELNLTEIDRIKNSISERKSYLEKRGIKYYIAVLPDKMSIYGKELPSHYNLVDTTRLDQLLPHLRKTNIPILDLRSAIKAEANNRLLYQKNDSHWNQNGGFIASQEIIKMLQKDFANLPGPFSIENYQITEKDKKGGDISMLLGIRAFANNSSFEYKGDSRVGIKKNAHNSLYNLYNEDYKATFIYDKDDKSLPKILVFNDSFISYIHGFLGDYFSRSVFLWTHNFRKDIIQRENPQIVLHLIVERSIESLGNSKPYDDVP